MDVFLGFSRVLSVTTSNLHTIKTTSPTIVLIWTKWASRGSDSVSRFWAKKSAANELFTCFEFYSISFFCICTFPILFILYHFQIRKWKQKVHHMFFSPSRTSSTSMMMDFWPPPVQNRYHSQNSLENNENLTMSRCQTLIPRKLFLVIFHRFEILFILDMKR